MTDRKTNNSTPDNDNDIGVDDDSTATAATAAPPPRSILSYFFSWSKHEQPKCPYKIERYYYYNNRNRNKNKNRSTNIISSKDDAVGSRLGSEKDKEGGNGGQRKKQDGQQHNHKATEEKDKDDEEEEDNNTNFEQSMDVYYPLVRLKEDEHSHKHTHDQELVVVVVLVMGAGWLGHVPMIYKVTHWWNTSMAHMICGTLGYPCIIIRHSGGYFTNYFDYNNDNTTTTSNHSNHPMFWIQLNLIAVLGLMALLYVQNDTVMLSSMSIVVVPVVVFLILNYQDHYPAAQLEDMVRDVSTALHYIDHHIFHHWKWNSFVPDDTEDKDVQLMQKKKKDKKKIPIVFGGYSSGAHVAATLLTSSSLSPLIVHDEENDDHGDDDSEGSEGSQFSNIGIVAVLYISGILDVPQSSFLMKVITYLVLGQPPRDIPSPLRTVHNLIKATTAPITKSGRKSGKEIVIQQNDSISAAAATVTSKKNKKTKNKKALIQSSAKIEKHEQEQLLLSLLGMGGATKKKAEEAKEKLIPTEQEQGEEQEHNILSLFPASFASSTSSTTTTTTTTTTTVRLRVPPHIIIGCQQELFGLRLLDTAFCHQKYADAVSQLMSTNNNDDDDDTNGKKLNPIHSDDDDQKEDVRLILLKDELIVNHWSILSSVELQKTLRTVLQHISSTQHQKLN